MMSDKALLNRQAIENIKQRMTLGHITYSEAKELARPIIEEINCGAKRLAKLHGVKAYKFSFAGLMR